MLNKELEVEEIGDETLVKDLITKMETNGIDKLHTESSIAIYVNANLDLTLEQIKVIKLGQSESFTVKDLHVYKIDASDLESLEFKDIVGRSDWMEVDYYHLNNLIEKKQNDYKEHLDQMDAWIGHL